MVALEDSVRIVAHRLEDLHDAVNGHLRKIDPAVLLVATIGGTIVYLKLVKLYRRSEEPLFKRIKGYVFSKFRQIPAVKAKIDKQLSTARSDMVETIHKDDTDRKFLTELPEEGLPRNEVLELARKYDKYGSFGIHEGKVSGAVYTEIGTEHLNLLTDIYRSYAYSNPLHADVFPGVRKMEAEVIRMVLNLYNAPAGSSGSITTGGTESIIMACFSYRNRAHEKGIESPVILCPITAHAAFDKAAHLCGMRVRHVPVDENGRVIVKAMEKLIDGDVCMLVGSAPNYPSGTIDSIEDISRLGVKYGIPVHVDACLGGFLIPFMGDAGYYLKPFDFRNKGVMSISCDTHKYGCTPKGSSVVMYRTQELHHYQYFSIPEWCGGIYATPTICGSRAGANTAAAWATLLMFGRQEYVERCRAIVSRAREIAAGIKDIPELKLLGSSDVSVVAFRSDVINIYAVADKMHKRGWNLNSLQNPSAVHICLTKNHTSTDVVKNFLKDVRETVNEVLEMPDKGNKSDTAALYGMAAQIPDKSLVDEMTAAYLDACYSAPPALTEK